MHLSQTFANSVLDRVDEKLADRLEEHNADILCQGLGEAVIPEGAMDSVFDSHFFIEQLLHSRLKTEPVQSGGTHVEDQLAYAPDGFVEGIAAFCDLAGTLRGPFPSQLLQLPLGQDQSLAAKTKGLLGRLFQQRMLDTNVERLAMLIALSCRRK